MVRAHLIVDNYNRKVTGSIAWTYSLKCIQGISHSYKCVTYYIKILSSLLLPTKYGCMLGEILWEKHEL